MRKIDKSVKSISDEEWNSMVSTMGKYKGYPVLVLKALLLAVINGESHRRRMAAADACRRKKYYAEYSLKHRRGSKKSNEISCSRQT